MTYDAQVATDVEGALQDLRDALDGLTDWIVVEDDIELNLQNGDGVVVTTPNTAPTGNAEAVHFWYERGNTYHFNLEIGDWDGATFTSQNQTIRSDLVEGNNNLESDDTVEYWLQRKAGDGFAMFIRRTTGDGNDGSIWFAYSILTKIWAYDTADFDESHGGIILAESNGIGNQNNQRQWTMFNTTNSWERPEGVLNPDLDFDNYLVKESLHETDTVQSQGGQRPWIGTQKLFLVEQSGTDVSSQDTVVDGADTVYEILKFNGFSWPLAIRAD